MIAPVNNDMMGKITFCFIRMTEKYRFTTEVTNCENTLLHAERHWFNNRWTYYIIVLLLLGQLYLKNFHAQFLPYREMET